MRPRNWGTVPLLQAAFRLALLLYPRDFRGRFGDRMAESFDVAVKARRGQAGLLAATTMAAGAVVNTAWNGLAERRLERARRRWTGQRREWMGMIGLAADLRQAWRRTKGRPGPSLLAIGMLALAIGVTTAMFTIVDALLLRPLPFPDADRLTRLVLFGPRGGPTTVAPEVLEAWRRSTVFEAVEGARDRTSIIDLGTGPLIRQAAVVSPGLMPMLGASPIRGRLFAAGDGRAGSADGLIIAESIWRHLLGARDDIVGLSIRVDDELRTVIGVLPDDFRFPEWNTALWMPVDFSQPPPGHEETPVAFVRFAAGVPRADALDAATDIAREIDPAMAASDDITATELAIAGASSSEYVSRLGPFLMGGAALVFLVLCANVASLLLGQMTSRSREFRMCAALGAPRHRLFRQAFAESVALGAAGAALGIGLTVGLVALARMYLPEAFLLRSLNPVDVDARALVAACAAGIAATLAAGLVPAWMGTSVRAGANLSTTERAGTETRMARTATRALLLAEVALGCTLLVGAGLLVRSFVNLTQVDRGLNATDVITGWVALDVPDEADADARRAAADRLVVDLEATAGIERVALSMGLPPDGSELYFGDDWRADSIGAEPVTLIANGYPVTQDFFDLYGIRLLAGRTFEPGDDNRKVIVGERFAEMFWPGESPIGRTYYRGTRGPYEVIGLVNELRHPSLDPRADLPETYYRYAGGGPSVMLSLECRSCPDVARLRQQLLSSGPVAFVSRLGVLEDEYQESLSRPRAAAALAMAFAAIALVAASGGLFSVLSYTVGRRRREFGIRASLGARPADLQVQVAGEGARLALAGATLGCLAAWYLSRWLDSLMYEVTPADPATWAVVVVTLSVTTVVAVWAPSRRAGRVSPAELLREG